MSRSTVNEPGIPQALTSEALTPHDEESGTSLHAKALQTCPAPHRLPQPPQFLGSLAGSMQPLLLQGTSSGPQRGVQLPTLHTLPSPQ